MSFLIGTVTPLVGIYIDLDGTFWAQLGLFLAAFVVIHFVVVRPFMDVVEEREAGIGGSQDRADEMQTEAEQLEEEYDEKMQQARREAQEVRQGLRDQGVQEQKEKVEEVREELRDKIESERQAIQEKVDDARSEMESRAEELATTMVEKIVPGT